MLEIRVRLPLTPLIKNEQWSCSPAAKAALLQSDNRRFESAQDHKEE